MAPSRKRKKTAEDKEQETFRKRRGGLTKKAHELSHFTKTDLYLVMFRGGRYYVYSSADRDGWPPSQSDIVSAGNAFLADGNADLQDTNYPPSERKGPSDFKAAAFPARRKRPSASQLNGGASPESSLDFSSTSWTGELAGNTPSTQPSGQSERNQSKPEKPAEHSGRGPAASVGLDPARSVAGELGKCDTRDGREPDVGKPEHDQTHARRHKFIIPKLPKLPQLFDPGTWRHLE